MHISVCERVRVCVPVCPMCMGEYTCMSICMCVHVCVFLCVHMCGGEYIYISLCISHADLAGLTSQ